MQHARRHTLGIYMLAFVALADQISKGLLLGHITDAHETIRATSFLNFVLVWNKGVTFGLLSHMTQGYFPYVLIGGASIIVLMLGRWLWKTHSALVALALGAIMGGAVGNVIDRLRFSGAVVDFIDFYYRDYHWYAFNIADAAIVAGIVLLLFDGMVRRQ